MASLHPRDGARIVLTRETAEGDVRYHVAIYEPESRLLTGAASFGETIALTWDEDVPAAWLETFVGRWLKALPKKHAEKQSWPRKLTRWRAERT